MKIIDIPWHQSITVKLQNGTAHRFTGAYDALDFLENEWPVRKGPHYANAILQCRAALASAVSAEVAREAFVASCLEAALHWTSGNVHVPPPRGRALHASA